MRQFLRHLFSSAARRADAVAVFQRRGFSEEEAHRAAAELWFSCRSGTPLSPWLREMLDSHPVPA